MMFILFQWTGLLGHMEKISMKCAHTVLEERILLKNKEFEMKEKEISEYLKEIC